MTEEFAVDLHVHTELSHDARAPVEVILDHAEDIEMDAIAITDHDRIENALRATKLAEDRDITVIPGVEVSTANGHLLALGVERRPEKGRKLQDTVEAVRAMGGTAVVPHPFQFTRHGARKRHITDCDAIEVYNPWLFTGLRNRRARTFAEKRDIPGVAFSDAHVAGMIGRAHTMIRAEPPLTQEKVLDAIKAGHESIEGKRQPIPVSTWNYIKCAFRKMAYFIPF